ncbi:hypothetical protein [Paraburkholderia phosphatilytica]|uniref:hypothetical protein n=1 Tax=Paraburkholderia phosphatilytica TaxID=2282883 RepID=UPI000E46CCC4|nr:hypothetical protein [Paraburkholderia phosphatilytica]
MGQVALRIVDIQSEPAHRFSGVVYRGIPWDLTHLDAFAFKTDLGLGSEISVLVLFSCHCFSHSFRRDGRERRFIPESEIYDDGRERRVLSPERYALSRKLLRQIIIHLPSRRITIAGERGPNFVTLENTNHDGTTSLYAVFFEVEKDDARRRRLILRVQSAYVLDEGLTKRQAGARKVAFETLLRAAYLGKKIRG